MAATTLFDDNALQIVGTNGSEATEDNWLRIRQYMKDNGAKPPFKGVVAPATYNGCLKLDRFSNFQYIGDKNKGKAVEMAHLGTIYNIDLYESQLTVGTAPNSAGAVWADGHFFTISQRTPTTHTWYDNLNLAWVVTMDQICDVFERAEADEAAAVTTTALLWGVYLRSAK